MEQPGCSGSNGSEYQQRRESFTRSLQHFHETRGTPFKRLPQFSGQDVDLFHLYNLVTERGGWIKVNRTNGWDDLVEEFKLPPNTVNGGNALKHIYLRFLDRYEKVHFLGDSGDRHDDEEDVESRHRRWSARAMHTVALTYNHHQHNISENVRRVSGLSTELYHPSEYDRLALSLVSPLPNEQDFAINVCTLLSTEGKHTLRLDKCPRLLDYLLAHAGVYNHISLRILFDEIYGRVRGHSIKAFWRDVIAREEVLELIDEEDGSWRRKMRCDSSSPNESSAKTDVADVRLEPVDENEARQLAEAEKYEAMLAAAMGKPLNKSQGPVENEKKTKSSSSSSNSSLTIEPDDMELFNLGREGGTRDYVGQRILQIAHILRNLSFNEDAIPIMSRNATLIRFLLLCSNARWSNLHQLGLDMLGNLAAELPLDEAPLTPLLPHLIGLVTRGVYASDRFLVLSSLELLNKICQREENEEIITRGIDVEVYDQVCSLLSLHDIMVLLYTLECLYSMSSMGKRPCNNICRAKGALQMLLSLISVEAQTYGPKACILMRVIETVSGGSASLSASTTTNPTGATVAATVPSAAASPNITVQSTSVGNAKITVGTPTLIRTPSPKTVVGMPMAAVATPVSLSTVPTTTPVSSTTVIVASPPVIKTSVTAATVTTVQQQHAAQQTAQENEQFALAWIRANYELSAGGRVEQQEIYRLFSEACVKFGRKPGITAAHFPRMVRSVFGGTVGPKPHSIQDAATGTTVTQSVYDGIQVRSQPLTINVKLVPAPDAVASSSPVRRRPSAGGGGSVSPILKAQLVSPLPNCTAASSAVAKCPVSSVGGSSSAVVVAANQVSPVASSNASVLSPCQDQQGTSPSSNPLPPPDMGNSNLIKSLLASKVTQRQARLQQAQNAVGKITRINGIVQDSNAITAISTQTPTVDSPQTNYNKSQQPRPSKVETADDSDSMASSSRDIGGGIVSSDNDNSLTSFEGIFLNGIDLEATVAAVESKNLNNATTSLKEEESKEPREGPKDSTREGPKEGSREGSKVESPPKKSSLMLAELLDRQDGTAVNGFIGEKGLELVEKAILAEKPINNGDSDASSRTTVNIRTKLKRGNGGSDTCGVREDTSCEEPEEKRQRVDGGPHETEGRTKAEVNGDSGSAEEEVKASSKAANLFAALAAEALEDEPEMEEEAAPATAVVDGVEANARVANSEQPSQPQVRPVFLTTAAAATAPVAEQPSLILHQAAPTSTSSTTVVAPAAATTRQLVVAAAPTNANAPQQIVQLTLPSASGGRLQQYIGVGGQQVLLTGQLIGQQQGAGGPKTIIILQPQTATAGGAVAGVGGKMVLTSAGNAVVVSRPLQTSPAEQTATLIPTATTPQTATEVSITQNGQGQVHLVRTAAAGGAAVTVASASNVTEGIQVIASGVQTGAACLVADTGGGGSPNSGVGEHLLYLCEWRACMRSFKSASEVYLHVCSCHCPVDPEQETQCLWSRCDGMKRKRFSLMTHLYDRHCNADALNAMAARRKQMNTQNRNEVQQPPPPVSHPGYAPNAALDAIKRHAGEFINPKEMLQQQKVQQQPTVLVGSGAKAAPGMAPSAAVPPASAILLAKAAATPPQVKDDNEGPVTKSIRLTASLILRNLVNYSSLGRRFLRGFESHLANIALSNVESSRTIAQVLADLNDPSNAR